MSALCGFCLEEDGLEEIPRGCDQVVSSSRAKKNKKGRSSWHAVLLASLFLSMCCCLLFSFCYVRKVKKFAKILFFHSLFRLIFSSVY
jgi:hypothetical protein